MVFSSNVFLYIFLPITLLIYFLLGKHIKLKNYWLLLVSLIFYAWNQPRFLWIIVFCVLINYLGCLFMDRIEVVPKRRAIMFIVIALNLLCLFYFKYFNFSIDMINKLFHSDISFTDVVLPIGISFFTFQSMSYVFDVYRKQVPVQRKLTNLALYIVLFPQLVAGPIVRYADVEKEISVRSICLDDIYYGVKRFILGLAKKVIIANTLAVTADSIWSMSPYEHTVSVAWIGLIAYSMQLYFDFSGYSDMAIGLGRVFGFCFNENFNYPFISKSISEFWRRWHMSLSTWFKDYVYIPLGGNRKHKLLNLFIVFFLTGLWHGAAYQFVAWGIWNGVFVIAENILQKKGLGFARKTRFSNLIMNIYAVFIFDMGLVLFRAPNIKTAIRYGASMFGMLKGITPGFEVGWYLDGYTILILLISFVWSTPVFAEIGKKVAGYVKETTYLWMQNIGLLLLFAYSIMRVVSSTYNPFIYFQF